MDGRLARKTYGAGCGAAADSRRGARMIQSYRAYLWSSPPAGQLGMVVVGLIAIGSLIPYADLLAAPLLVYAGRQIGAPQGRDRAPRLIAEAAAREVADAVAGMAERTAVRLVAVRARDEVTYADAVDERIARIPAAAGQPDDDKEGDQDQGNISRGYGTVSHLTA